MSSLAYHPILITFHSKLDYFYYLILKIYPYQKYFVVIILGRLGIATLTKDRSTRKQKHKASLNKYKTIEVTSCILSDN
jgi:hypothetical protein